jgi:hypothetical protein
MKNKISKVLPISAIIAVLILLVPAIFVCDLKESFTLGALLLTGIAAYSTFVVAFMFYDKFGVGKKLTDKQTDILIELLECLKKTRFLIAIKEENSGQLLIMRGMSKDLSYFKSESFNNRYVTFNFNNYETEMAQILMYMNNIWIPPEIKEKLMFFNMSSLRTEIDMYKNNSVLITINKGLDQTDDKKYGRKNDEDIKYIQFITAMETLVNSIDEWLQNHSNIPIKLNL